MSSIPFGILTADHTGITVSNLERSLAFWRDVLGFELSHRVHQTGELALQYLAPADRKQHVDLRPCDVGSVHVALTVDDLDAVLEKVAASGWKADHKPQTLTTGPNAGKRVIYVRDPDGTTIEFMQPPAQSD